jgi:hypothetical protein
VVQSTDAWKGDDFAGSRRLNVACDRRVSAKRHVRPIAVVIGHMLADQTQQMALSKHDDVIEQLAA